MLNRIVTVILRFVVCGFILCSWLDGGPAEASAKSGLSGRVTNQTVSGVVVRLKAVDQSLMGRYDGYSATLDSDGSFHFEDVDPGTYLLLAKGGDFLDYQYGAVDGDSGTPIRLAAGEHRKGVVVTLTPKKVVCGKVTDENGKPLKVEIYSFAHRKGTNWLTFDDGDDMRTVTDDDGNYKLDLGPGEYFIQAAMSTWFVSSSTLSQPEAESLANAEPVEVGAATGTGCQENIRIGPRLGYYAFHIRGKIANDPSLTGQNLVLSLLEVSRSGAARAYPGGGARAQLSAGQSFDLTGMPAGHYRLVLANGGFPAMWAGPPSEFHVLASREITLAADVNGITLVPDPMASLSGQVKLESITPVAACPSRDKPHLSIQKDDDGQFHQMELGPDGSFTFHQVAPGTYTVRIYPFLRGAVYVKSMLLDGNPVASRKIEISSTGSHTLTVLLSGGQSAARGHLLPNEPVERYLEPWAHPKASLSGKVTNVTAGSAPWIKLWSVRFNSDRSYEYSTKPMPDGTFHFDNVDPGVYLLLTQGPGYVLSEYGASEPGLQGKAITLKAGQQLAGLTLTSSPEQPGICGGVTDENGRPLADAPVFAWFRSHEIGQLLQPGVSTDGDGNFRFLGLKKGQYFIWTDSSVMAPSGDIQVQRLTYYPSSPNLDGAQPIEVGAAPDSECVHNIQMRSSPTYHVRGRLVAPIAHELGDHFYVSLVETNAAGAEQWRGNSHSIKPGSDFDFPAVRPGHYRIRVTSAFGEPLRMWSGPCGGPPSRLVVSQVIVVADRDLNDVALAPGAVASVSGQISFEDISKEWKGFTVEAQSVSLSVGNELCPRSVKPTPQGTFIFDDVEAGTYQINVNLSVPMYIKTMLLDGQPLEGRHITLHEGQSAKLTVVVNGNGGEVDAAVAPSAPLAEEHRNDEPCGPDMAVTPYVFLIPDPIPADGSGVVTGSLTQEGYFEIRGVAPGHYRALAGENFDLLNALTPFGNSGWSDGKFLRAVAAYGEPIEVANGQKIKLSLRSSTVEIQDTQAEQGQEATIGQHCAAACSYEDLWRGSEGSGTH